MSIECEACRGSGYLVDACPDCGGNSAYESHSCGRCEGRGQIEMPCHSCNGKGAAATAYDV